MRSVFTRIERAERLAKAQSKFSVDCICFPAIESAQLAFDVEFQIAAAVKCPLHGERFKPPQLRVWMREKGHSVLWSHHSEQYRKAWFASFPESLWPAQEIEDEEGATYLILSDGTRLSAMEPIRSDKQS